jgi:DNA helicase II / ATP-dependent DNA helicase PcrA
MAGFLEHVALVMDTDTAQADDKVSIMTLHGAKGLEFDTVFLPGWEEGLFPHQRSLDENGRAGLEEERRLAYVGITRAKRGAVVSFAQNRRVHNSWQTAVPSRFIDELPEAHVEVDSSQSYGGYGVGYGASRFEEAFASSSYQTPGWQRAQAREAHRSSQPLPAAPRTIEGRLLAQDAESSPFEPGEQVFHQKFGPGLVTRVDGNKLTVQFDHAGEKRVIDSFVERH